MSANDAGLLTAGGAEEYLHPTRRRQINHAVQNMTIDPGFWPPESLIPAVALAQHHGVPTRMLDWSFRAFIAAYFAVREVAKKIRRHREVPDWDQVAVWCLRYERIPTLIERNASLHREKKRKPRFSFVQVPRAGNANLHAQHGVFVLDRGYFPEETSLDDLVELTESKGMLIKVTAPAGIAPRILRLLHAHGVGAGTLFPGYDGAAKQARELWYWDNPPNPPPDE